MLSLSLLLRGRGEEEAGSSFLPSGEVGKWKFPVSAAERVAVAAFGTRYVIRKGGKETPDNKSRGFFSSVL